MNNKLKIIFLCGSLEPGRDGVGDYTRRLAGEIIKQGHKAGIIALYDHFIAEEIVDWQQSEETELPVLRIPSSIISLKRFKLAKEWIGNFNPEWLSLQYVPFSFHYKGLPFGLNKQVAGLRKGAFLHIMFHELWIGEGESFRKNIYGSLQKMIFRQMRKTLRPEVIHTHLPHYYLKLKKLKFDPIPLPLFSNVPIEQNQKERKADQVFRVGIFSQIRSDSSTINFLRNLYKVVSQKKMSLEVLLIGDNDRLKNFGAILECIDGFKEAVKYTGFLEDTAVSTAIQTCSVGLTSMPPHVLGKSGSVAAFLAHGIPVAAPLANDYNSTEIGFFSPDLRSSIVQTSNVEDIERAKESISLAQKNLQISSVANFFLFDLTIKAECRSQDSIEDVLF